MDNVNEGERWERAWIWEGHQGGPTIHGAGVLFDEPLHEGEQSWLRWTEVVPAEALRAVECDLLAVVDMWRGRFEDAAFRETGLHEALRKETGALREAEAEVARLREALGRFGGHRDDCDVIAGAPDCNCGFDEAYVRVRQAARGLESESKTGGHE